MPNLFYAGFNFTHQPDLPSKLAQFVADRSLPWGMYDWVAGKAHHVVP